MASMKIGIVLLCSLLYCLSASAGQIKEHPTPADTAQTLREMGVTLNELNDPCSGLASVEWGFERAEGLHKNIDGLKTLLKSWDSIEQVRPQELPLASDMFSIYTSFLNIRNWCEGLADQQGKEDSSISNNQMATKILKALAKSVTVLEDLDPAIYDAITKLEKKTR